MRAGWEQQEIAAHLGVSEATVSNDVEAIKKALRVETQEALRDVVAQELASLDGDEAVLKELMGKATTETMVLRFHEAILRVQQRRAQLLGLDEGGRGEEQGWWRRSSGSIGRAGCATRPLG